MNQKTDLGPVIGVSALAVWVLVGTFGFVAIEGWAVIDAFYMTIITISTVGFKEVRTLSPAGQLFTSFIIIGGLGTAAYTTTRLGQLVLEKELLRILGRRKMKTELAWLRDHLIICGYGCIGRPVVPGIRKDLVPFRIVAIKRGTGQMIFNPDPSEMIGAGDVLVALGKQETLTGLENACGA